MTDEPSSAPEPWRVVVFTNMPGGIVYSTVDQIVRRLEAENGRFSALLTGIIESAPFQKQRTAATGTSQAPASSPEPTNQLSIP